MDKKYHIIYITKNIINQKCYVGFHSTNILNDNYLGSGIALKNAIKKYGKENFKKTILEHCDNFNWPEREIYWIKEKNTFGKNGYNLTIGGEGRGGGFSVLEETKAKISNTLKGRKLSKDHPFNISNIPWNKGKKMDQPSLKKGIPLFKEIKEKISNTLKGQRLPDHHPFKIKGKERIPWNKGKKMNQPSWNKGKKMSDETKEKISISKKGTKLSIETKRKISISKRKIMHAI